MRNLLVGLFELGLAAWLFPWPGSQEIVQGLFAGVVFASAIREFSGYSSRRK